MYRISFAWHYPLPYLHCVGCQILGGVGVLIIVYMFVKGMSYCMGRLLGHSCVSFHVELRLIDFTSSSEHSSWTCVVMFGRPTLLNVWNKFIE